MESHLVGHNRRFHRCASRDDDLVCRRLLPAMWSFRLGDAPRASPGKYQVLGSTRKRLPYVSMAGALAKYQWSHMSIVERTCLATIRLAGVLSCTDDESRLLSSLLSVWKTDSAGVVKRSATGAGQVDRRARADVGVGMQSVGTWGTIKTAMSFVTMEDTTVLIPRLKGAGYFFIPFGIHPSRGPSPATAPESPSHSLPAMLSSARIGEAQ